MHDAVIVGGGHNGLVAAAYLARAGLRVLRARAAGRAGRRRRQRQPVRRPRRPAVALLVPGLAVPGPRSRATWACEVRAAPPARRRLRGGPAVWDEVPGIGVDRRLFDSLLEPRCPTSAARGRRSATTRCVDRPLGDLLRERWDDPLVRGVVGTDGLIGTFASLDDADLRQNRCYLWHVIGGPLAGAGRRDGGADPRARRSCRPRPAPTCAAAPRSSTWTTEPTRARSPGRGRHGGAHGHRPLGAREPRAGREQRVRRGQPDEGQHAARPAAAAARRDARRRTRSRAPSASTRASAELEAAYARGRARAACPSARRRSSTATR